MVMKHFKAMLCMSRCTHIILTRLSLKGVLIDEYMYLLWSVKSFY